MKYRKLGTTGLRVSEISLGTEYLIDIPEQQAINVIRMAVERGVNYFDLFFAQPGFRDIMGRAFTGLRDKVHFAAHLGASHKDGQYERTRSLELSEHYIHDFLKRYNTDYVDVLFLHNSDGQDDFEEIMKPGGLYDIAQRFKREGKARHIAFSSHTVDTSLKAMQDDQIELLMFPINLASHAVPGKRELLTACVERGKGLVAMKPFAGGKLLLQEDEIALENFHSAGGKYTLKKRKTITAPQCIAYVLDQSGVSCVVPGCASTEHLEDVLSYYEADSETLDYTDHLVGFDQYKSGECVYCNHCLPCPVGIDIGACNRLLDQSPDRPSEAVRKRYNALEVNAGDCVQCGACEKRCPFSVGVIDRLEQLDNLYG